MTPPSARGAQVQAAWTAHRPYLLAVAAGMLKRRDDAEDVVQEAFARLAASPDAIEDVRGWLVVVTRRLCLDRLSPAERTSFILHDVFGFPFDAVAGLVGRTPAACRQLARRARLSVGTGLPNGELAGAWSGNTTPAALAERFIAVCEGGDVTGLIGMLDPEVASFPVVIGLPPMPAVRGAEAVAARVMYRFGPLAGVSMQPFDVEGRAAVVVRRGDEVVAVVRLDDRDGRIIHVHTVARPSLAR